MGMSLKRNHLLMLLAILVILGSGCNGQDEKRDKVIQSYNSWLTHHNSFATTFKKSQHAKDPAETKSLHKGCKREIEAVTPYEPLGVDPRLAAAISEWRAAALAYVDYLLDDNSRVIPEGTNHPRMKSQAAAEKIDAVLNQIASEIGGIKK